MSHEFSGQVSDIGKGVSKVVPGDRVGVFPIISCGNCSSCRDSRNFACVNSGCFGLSMDGGFQEYCVLPERYIFKLPDNLGEDQAALNEPVGFGLNTFNLAKIRIGEDIVIFGAGTIGLILLQIARIVGARNVYMIGRREKRLNAAKELKADAVIDIDKEDYYKRIMDLTNGEGVDTVIDATGSVSVLEQAFRVTKYNGKIVTTSIFTQKAKNLDLNQIVIPGKQLIGSIAHNEDQYETALKMQSDNRVNVKPIITTIINLEDILDKGFKAYINNKNEHIKILVKP